MEWMEYFKLYEHSTDDDTAKTYLVKNVYTLLQEVEKGMKKILQRRFSDKHPFIILYPSILRNMGEISHPQYPHLDYYPSV
eukprot:10158315-Ditylum_brightwellii.AAC.1